METATVVEVHFNLDVEDNWPPVAQEGLLFTKNEGQFILKTPPLFLKNLSVGDLLEIKLGIDHEAVSYSILEKSRNSTVWLLRLSACNDIETTLLCLQRLNCTSVELPLLGCYSIDVPESTNIHDVDACLAYLNPEQVAIAYPSFRHDEK